MSNNVSNTQIQVTLTDDKTIRELNKKWRDKDAVTDVLSFELDEEGLLGEIVVNREQAERQAAEYGNDVEHEIAALVEHGVLHLLGVHHEGDE
jgi:probable rRNA maturation factor